jgi:type I restriction enzyme R subunit
VRPQRQHVDFYADFANWHTISAEPHAEVTEQLAPLPTAFKEDENSKEAKRFDPLVLRLQLAHLGAERGYDHPGRARTTATPRRAGHRRPVAGRHPADAGVDAPPRRRLVKLIREDAPRVVYSDFEDQLGAVVLVPVWIEARLGRP